MTDSGHEEREGFVVDTGRSTRTRQIADRYIVDGDLEAFAADVTYVNMATEEAFHGRDAIHEMLATFYRDSFEGSYEVTKAIYGEATAVMEFTWRGTHIDEFEDIPATDRTVTMPCCLVMDIGEDHIERARLYPQMNHLFDDFFDALGLSREFSDLKVRQQYRDVLNRVLRHNLRNELNVIVGCAELLADETGENAEPAAMIQAAGDRLLTIGEKSRSLARLAVGGDFADEPVDVVAVVRDVVFDRREAFPDSAITAILPDDPVVVRSDATLLTTVLNEVIENAIVHNDTTPPRVEVAVTPAAAGGDAVEITIADTGPGIPDQERESLRREQETPLLHGSGVGLWTVKWGIERLGGGLEFGPNEPRGTVVRLSIPVDRFSKGGRRDG